MLALPNNADAATLQPLRAKLQRHHSRPRSAPATNIWKLSINPYVVALAANVWRVHREIGSFQWWINPSMVNGSTKIRSFDPPVINQITVRYRSGSAWADATDVVGGEQIHIIAKTLTDFDLADDNADLPAGFDCTSFTASPTIGPIIDGLPLEERLRLRQQMKDAYDEVFPYHVGSATNYHNLARYM